ncbi:cobaltochelatase CobN [Clostridium tetanomorphum]|uniref:cobaltochelatase subunit CobN n=1 Tax=Clostridium tetanomorphum TaxID=1553 RepID=UPI00045164DC|nr:cobaltochelatase subunit CobN [Clostridium tetanomorphum]KAJ52355.1 aerobic cobaltochelatase subunit CobN2 [Clostridium tetanomorphum DSM 665]MBP1864810.1 cobaltochelatase CobN [Clostridium tetanomorphum]NRS83986.1 cobaltochelatase CobN [Clostridium tetanomorphum]SQB92975.1 Aerobic cobaltochelatase subunit CobN [Clostridium tetanomorphum]
MFKLLFIMSPMDSVYKLKEVKLSLQEKYKDQFSMKFIDTYTIDENPEEFNRCIKEIESSDMIFITAHGGITYFKSLDKIMDKYQGKKRFFIHSGIQDENASLLKKSGISQKEYVEILRYFLIDDNENLENMILHLAVYFGGENYKVNPPRYPNWEGIYYPGKNIEDYEEYIEEAKKSGRPIIGILFYSKYMRENNLKHIDTFIREIEVLGGVPLAVYTATAPDSSVGCRGFQWTLDNILMKEGKPIVHAIINTIGYSQSILSNPGDGTTTVEKSIFESIGVPVLQALNTYQSFDTWKNSIQGIDMMSLTGNVYYPEFDGQIITVTTSYCERVVDEIGERLVFKPIEERINKVCRLALNWAKLRTIDNKDKKVAILFHNMPPRNDMIGCAFGLDTPAAVLDMVKALKKEGVYTEYDFENGDEIINRIIDAVSNDMRWFSAEKALEKSVDIIDGNLYRQWFSKLGESVQEKMVHDWDTPPGEFMVFDDKLPVPGIINGNIFIGLQPQRGYEEKADEVYHSTDIVPPHQYIAFYKWIKNVFKADVIAHIGTHGTVEWLPGKEVGLSENCYTDICIDDMPHVYPYSINVVGEGIQVKRRGCGVILDHLIPSLTQSGTYGEMENIDELIKQYYHAKQGDNTKVKHIQDEIIELVIKNNYHIDLNMSKEEIQGDFEDFMERFHGWIEEIKNSLIKDGLHLFGRVPQGERFENLVSALLRLSNGNVCSLINGVCTAYGLDYEHLKNHPYETNNEGVTNLMLLDKMEEVSREIIKKLHNSDYTVEAIENILVEYFKKQPVEKVRKLYETLKFAATVVKDKLDSTTDEIKHFVYGVNGKFVPPGGSGSPTRGRVDILPTGRNFYSIDPTSVPTKAAWKVGKQLGDNLINRYLKDDGKYPETVAMIVYAGETMKTCGDDIAEALYLMGIKPKWLESTDKVVGLEVMPLQELKRPRIDVTLRISGLFRDTFPNIIELVEDGVNLAAGLDEGEDVNYIRKNIFNEVNELVKNGMNVEEAQQEASLRIFGCPPGTYGAGVDVLINSKNWNDFTDLGNVYALWSGHAYGRKIHGKKTKEVFERRMSLTEITVKNESSQEIDILDSDDFYNYHGGMIAAVRTFSGKIPKSYSGDTSDPARAKVREVKEETARIMRSRILNPKWFEGLKPHGYKGAQEISGMVDFVFGWDATADVIEDWMYEKISEAYLFDDERREWIKSVNPWAIHSMVERLLEANQRGMWNGDKESIDKLKQLYMDIEGDIEEYV